MSDRILDYNYDRAKSAKEEMEYVLSRSDSWSILNGITVESRVLGLDGQTYVSYASVGLKELAKRSYIIHWGFQHPSILYTDVAHLPRDIRVHNTEHNNLPIHRLTAMEQAMMKSNFNKYLAKPLKFWGKVDTVKAK